jgi:proline iminopeptidase
MNKSAYNIAVDGCNISIQCFGSGSTIVIIAGGPGLSTDYLIAPFLRLAPIRRVVFFDQPGCGRSGGTAIPSTENTVSATIRVIEEVTKGQNFTLAAHSWGAYLAARYCETSDKLPLSTILMNPPPLDRTGFDRVGGRLRDRVAPEDMKTISELMSIGTAEAGKELMRIAMPA